MGGFQYLSLIILIFCESLVIQRLIELNSPLSLNRAKCHWFSDVNLVPSEKKVMNFNQLALFIYIVTSVDYFYL